jgi:pimeloyl-ACP methyl ester carboxylesterase
MRASWPIRAGAAALVFGGAAEGADRRDRPATLAPHLAVVRGADVSAVSVRAERPNGGPWRSVPWDDLERTPLEPGGYEIRLATEAAGGNASLSVPPCAGRGRVTVDGRDVAAPPGPLVVPLRPGSHEVVAFVTVSAYERRIACGDRVRVGEAVQTNEGLGLLAFASPWGSRGGGQAVAYVPPGHDTRAAGALLVGLHPWNGSPWTYAAYDGLLREARARDVVILMPSGLGNSLYKADAEDEVLRAIAALSEVVAIDPSAVSIWGASMGGAGATTIAFHHPDLFASVTSFFGDSDYDTSTYVRSLLPDRAAAHLVNALDVVDNARYLPVWLVHGEDDRTSPIRQSEVLATALRDRGFRVRFDRVPNVGHSGALVAGRVADVVDAAASARRPAVQPRVTYRSVRESDTGAYGVDIVRARARGDAVVDVERRDGAVHVLRAQGVASIVLSPGALGTAPDLPPPIVVDDREAGSIEVRWKTSR